MKNSVLFILLFMFLAAGCSSVSDMIPGMGGKEEENEPTELNKIVEIATLKGAWKKSSGEIERENRQMQPILVDTTLFAASSDGEITAFDADSGKELWSRKTKLSLSAGVGYGNGLILAGTENGEVVALYASNGKPAWVGYARGGIMASPEGGNDTIVAPVSGNRLVGLSATDGTLTWTLTEATPRLLLRGRGRPLVVSDVVFAGFDNGKIMLIRLDNGQRLWEVRVGDAIGKTEIERLADADSKPILVDETLYAAAYQSRIVAIDARNAQIIWENEISTNKDMDAGQKYLYAVGEEDIVYAIDRSTGETVWEQDGLAYRKLSAPAIIGSYILVGDGEGYLHLLNSETGELEGRQKISGRLLSQPVTRGNSAWLQTAEGDIYAFQLIN
jgi:outer membrane protein assembly factor BamB